MELSILPVIKLEFLFHCDTHSQSFLSLAGLLGRKKKKRVRHTNLWLQFLGKCEPKHTVVTMSVCDCN